MIKSTAPPKYRLLVFALSVLAIAGFGCSKHADTKETHLSRANDFFAAQQFDKAAKEYGEALRLAPADPAVLRQLAIIYYDQGIISKAYPALKKAAELLPDDVEVQLRLGLTLQSLRQYKEAREAALRVLEKQPGHQQALVLLADTALGLNDAEAMRGFIQGLRDKDQDRAGYHLALGLLDLRQNDQAGAESEFKAALALDPKSVGALTAIANALLEPQRSRRSRAGIQNCRRFCPATISGVAAICGFQTSYWSRSRRGKNPGRHHRQGARLPARSSLPDENCLRSTAN